jgi:hypothetical protein
MDENVNKHKNRRKERKEKRKVETDTISNLQKI